MFWCPRLFALNYIRYEYSDQIRTTNIGSYVCQYIRRYYIETFDNLALTLSTRAFFVFFIAFFLCSIDDIREKRYEPKNLINLRSLEELDVNRFQNVIDNFLSMK